MQRVHLAIMGDTMRLLRLVGVGTALVIVGGCADGRTLLEPSAPAARQQSLSPAREASPAQQVDASGSFDAFVDFSTLTLTPRGQNCLLTVKGLLVFHGTIEGTGTGQTNALVSATCEEVASAPPGTYPDVFKSELVFVGTIGGQEVTANALYMGRSQPGGHIDGRFVFSHGAAGRLDADAQIAVGGTYQGQLVVP
jgi:hypothetical protein